MDRDKGGLGYESCEKQVGKGLDDAGRVYGLEVEGGAHRETTRVSLAKHQFCQPCGVLVKGLPDGGVGLPRLA